MGRLAKEDLHGKTEQRFPSWGLRFRDENAQDKIIIVTPQRQSNLTPPPPQRWCNNYLGERNIVIDDLFQDVNDGTALLNLLEVIGKDSVPSVCGRKFYPR